jgi:hypothetical protein
MKTPIYDSDFAILGQDIVTSLSLKQGDYAISLDGSVWACNGTTMINTNIVLKGATGEIGPTGATGATGTNGLTIKGNLEPAAVMFSFPLISKINDAYVISRDALLGEFPENAKKGDLWICVKGSETICDEDKCFTTQPEFNFSGVNLCGPTGDKGLTPYIGENGNWWIGETDTEIKAKNEELLIKTTYNELRDLVNSSSLIPRQKYRITDYETITIQSGTQSAGHQFDIIVTALNESTLSENASAIQHEGDTYFTNSDLSAWKLKYKLENDDVNYGWVDSVNGKGFIYEMTDEFNNTLPYDFKNIMFKRYAVVNSFNGVIGNYAAWDGISMENLTYDSNECKYFYTFSCYDNDDVYDTSLNIYSNNANKLIVTNNHYLPAKLAMIAAKGKQYILNDIAHICKIELEEGNYCAGVNNTKLGLGCYNYTIFDGCSNWEIKDNSKEIIICSGCNGWEIGNNSNNIIIEINNSGWKIGNDCNNISTVPGCCGWSIGNNSFNISVIHYCSNWKIGNGCHDFDIQSTANCFEMLNGFNGLVDSQRTTIDLPGTDFRGQQISYPLFIGQNEYNVLTIWNPASPINYQYVERNTYWGGNFTNGTPHDILPNTYNEWTSKAPKAIRLVKPEENKTSEYVLKFTVSDTGHSIVFENEIKWRNNDIPMWETGKTYEINIMNGLASYMEF